MTNQRLLMFTNDGDFAQHTIAEIPSSQAETLKAQGKAVEVSFGDYDQLKQKAKQVHEDYLKKSKRIKQDKHPRWNVPGAREYELEQIEREYEEQSKAIQAEWSAKRDAMVEQAYKKAAQATVKVTDADRATAEQLVNRYMLQAVEANDFGRLDTLIERLGKDISYLTDAQKTALQGRITDLVGTIQAKARERIPNGNQASSIVSKTANLYADVSDIRNLDLLAGKVADQLPINPALDYSHKKLVRRRRK